MELYEVISLIIFPLTTLFLSYYLYKSLVEIDKLKSGNNQNYKNKYNKVITEINKLLDSSKLNYSEERK